MNHRGAAILTIAGLVLAGAACGHRQQGVVDNYFRAVQAGDNQTLSSFALVGFDQKVENWKIVAGQPENEAPTPLPELAKHVADAEAALAANKKEYNAYFLDHPSEVDQVRELLRNEARIPAKLQQYADDWQAFIEKEKGLKHALAEAKDALAREKKNVTLSVEPDDGVEALVGKVLSQDIDLLVTVNGQERPYTMTLRKYDVSETEGGPKRLSRWVIYDLKPKG
jgi:hypothetical protein